MSGIRVPAAAPLYPIENILYRVFIFSPDLDSDDFVYNVHSDGVVHFNYWGGDGSVDDSYGIFDCMHSPNFYSDNGLSAYYVSSGGNVNNGYVGVDWDSCG